MTEPSTDQAPEAPAAPERKSPVDDLSPAYAHALWAVIKEILDHLKL